MTFVDFLKKVEERVPDGVGRIYAIMDNLKAHRAYDVLLFNAAHPRWEFVFQPKYAAYLNLIEPWWKTLKSLAVKGAFLRDVGADRRGDPTRRRVLERFTRGVSSPSHHPKDAGIGRERGPEALGSFTNVKSIIAPR